MHSVFTSKLKPHQRVLKRLFDAVFVVELKKVYAPDLMISSHSTDIETVDIIRL